LLNERHGVGRMYADLPIFKHFLMPT